MAWTRLGLALYICAILNLCYAFYSLTQVNLINTVISLATYLILIYAVAIIEDERKSN
jgi:hypothetical protein